jgi:hypothetical protein
MVEKKLDWPHMAHWRKKDGFQVNPQLTHCLKTIRYSSLLLLLEGEGRQAGIPGEK